MDKQRFPYEDAVDLLDADHKTVTKMFIDYSGLCQDGTTPEGKRDLALRICQALTVHTQIEEEIFYPAVREATGDDALLDEAVKEHAEAKKLIAGIQGMKASDPNFDATVLQLGKAIAEHVTEERGEIFLEACRSPLDMRALAIPLYERKQELMKSAQASAKTAVKETA